MRGLSPSLCPWQVENASFLFSLFSSTPPPLTWEVAIHHSQSVNASLCTCVCEKSVCEGDL